MGDPFFFFPRLFVELLLGKFGSLSPAATGERDHFFLVHLLLPTLPLLRLLGQFCQKLSVSVDEIDI